MERSIKGLTQFIARISLGASALAAFLLVLLTVEQVIARYFFDASSVALQELEWHLFGVIILLALPACFQGNRNVRIDLIYSKLSARKQATIDFLGTLLFLLPCCALLVYYGFDFAKSSYSFESPVAADSVTKSLCGDQRGLLCSSLESFEALTRKYILRGEISSDPGGLEARWIIKGLIPLSFALLFLLGLAQLFSITGRIIRGEEE